MKREKLKQLLVSLKPKVFSRRPKIRSQALNHTPQPRQATQPHSEDRPLDEDSNTAGPLQAEAAPFSPSDHDTPESTGLATTSTSLEVTKDPSSDDGNEPRSTTLSRSTTASILPLQRCQTFPRAPASPKNYTPRVDSWKDRPMPLRVKLIIAFGTQEKETDLDIPEHSTVAEGYKLIVGEAKQYALDICDGELEGKELNLVEGYCKVLCDARGKESFRLENDHDWALITTLLANWERSGYKDIQVIIRRTIECRKPPTMPLDLPQPDRVYRDWLYRQLSRPGNALIKTYSETTFIPRGTIELYTNKDLIRCIVKDENYLSEDEREELTEWIHRNAPRLFLLVVRLRMSLKVLQDARKNGFTDKTLPIESIQGEWLTDLGDRDAWVADLDKNQWDYCAADFDPSKLNQKFNNRIVLPFLEKVQIGQGAYSFVYAVQVESSHQHLYRPDVNPRLALKSIDRHKSRGNAFRQEQILLEGMRSMNHLHMIKLLATYEHDDQFHLLFPLARCNLRDYMLKDAQSRRSKEFIFWFLEQVEGLAGAIHLIHEEGSPTIKPEKATNLLQPNASLQIPKARPQGTGYHHDIKPENILHFDELDREIPPLGVYQIADFGVGKFHEFLPKTGEKSRGTTHPRGTVTYAAPESRIPSPEAGNAEKGKLHVSRPYDVWSFGCVVMEMLVWLVLGKQEWADFEHNRFGPVWGDDKTEDSDAFWVGDASFRNPKVRPAVKNMLKALRESEATRSSKSLLLIVDLIEEILEVDPNKRIVMSEVITKLGTAIEAAGVDGAKLSDIDIAQKPTPRVTILEHDGRVTPTIISESAGLMVPPRTSSPRLVSGRSPKRSSLKRPASQILLPQESRPPPTGQ